MKVNKDQYLKIRPERRDYLGERYFRFNFDNDKVVQVCASTGDTKRGKSNTIGIYAIAKLTFYSNYLSLNYVEVCSKKDFEKKFEEAVNFLK